MKGPSYISHAFHFTKHILTYIPYNLAQGTAGLLDEEFFVVKFGSKEIYVYHHSSLSLLSTISLFYKGVMLKKTITSQKI